MTDVCLGGKSLTYQLPALLFDVRHYLRMNQCPCPDFRPLSQGLTLVVLPLISLMKDQTDFLQSCGVKARRLDSQTSTELRHTINEEVLTGECKVLFVAPER